MTNLKKFFKFSLAAIALTLGVTSCDKEANGAEQQIINGELHEISFSENVSTGSASGKTAAQFAANHNYGETQILTILDSGGTMVWQGEYDPGDISTLLPTVSHSAQIRLPDGSYTANSVLKDDASASVLSFLPYTSSDSFTLPGDSVIDLVVSHSHGLAVINVEAAHEGSRVTSATANGDALLLDSSDAFGDRYGYLAAGDKTFSISYLLNGEATVISGNLEIEAGKHHTIDLTLDPDNVASEEITTSIATSTEAAEGDQNADGDTYDSLSRTVTSTQALINGVASGEPTIENGAWEITNDLNDSSSDSSSTEDSNEADISQDINSDGDQIDDISRIVTVTTVTLGDGSGTTSSTSEGAWSVSRNLTDATTGESGAGTGGGDGTFIPNTVQNWAPAFGTQTASFEQTGTDANGNTGTRTIVITASAAVETAGAIASVSSSFTSNGASLTQTSVADVRAAVTQPGTYTIVETRTTTYEVGTSVITYSGDNGFVSHDVISPYQADPLVEVIPSFDIVNVVDNRQDSGWATNGIITGGASLGLFQIGAVTTEYSYNGGAWGSLADAQAAADAAISTPGTTTISIDVRTRQDQEERYAVRFAQEAYTCLDACDGTETDGQIRQGSELSALAPTAGAELVQAGTAVSYDVVNAAQAPVAVTGTITTTPGLFGGFSYSISGLSNGGADIVDDFLYDTEAEAIAAAQAYLDSL